MKNALAIMAALAASMGTELTYDALGIKNKTPKKVWNKDLKCYTINGVPVDREGKPIDKEESK